MYITIFECSSQLSAYSIIVVPSEIYSFGSHYLLVLPAIIVMVFVVTYGILPIFYEQNLDNCFAVRVWLSDTIGLKTDVDNDDAGFIFISIWSFVSARQHAVLPRSCSSVPSC